METACKRQEMLTGTLVLLLLFCVFFIFLVFFLITRDFVRVLVPMIAVSSLDSDTMMSQGW